MTAIDPLFAQWLMSDGYHQVSTDAVLRARWGDKTQSSERLTTIANRADAATEAARQIAFLGGNGPLVIEEHAVLGAWAPYLGCMVRLTTDFLFDGASLALRYQLDNATAQDMITKLSGGFATAPFPAVGRAISRIDVVQGSTVVPVYDFSAASLPAGATLARATTGTRVNVSGQIESIAANAPRFDYDPITHAFRGLLLEPASNNLLLYSQSHATGWSTVSAALANNAAAAPDGTTTATALNDTTSNGGHLASAPAVVPTAAATYTYSTFLKRGANRYAAAHVTGGGLATPIYVSIDFDSAGALSTGNGAPLSTGVTAYPSGWYRLSLAFQAASNAALTCSIYGAGGAAYANRVYTGSGGVAAYQWGSQLEPGPTATSYIPTTNAIAPRAADGLVLAAAAIGGNYVDVFVIGAEDNRTTGTSTVTVIRRL